MKTDFSRMKAEVAEREHGEWCGAVLSYDAWDASGRLRPKKRHCTCGLSALRERIERLEGMALDAGKESN